MNKNNTNDKKKKMQQDGKRDYTLGSLNTSFQISKDWIAIFRGKRQILKSFKKSKQARNNT